MNDRWRPSLCSWFWCFRLWNASNVIQRLELLQAHIHRTSLTGRRCFSACLQYSHDVYSSSDNAIEFVSRVDNAPLCSDTSGCKWPTQDRIVVKATALSIKSRFGSRSSSLFDIDAVTVINREKVRLLHAVSYGLYTDMDGTNLEDMDVYVCCWHSCIVRQLSQEDHQEAERKQLFLSYMVDIYAGF